MTKVSKFFERIWDKVEGLFDDTEKEVVEFLDSFAHLLIMSGGAVLMAAAKQGYAAAENAGGSGYDKFLVAQKTAIGYLTQNGIPVVIAAVNGAIEAVVASNKIAKALAGQGDQAAAPETVPASALADVQPELPSHENVTQPEALEPVAATETQAAPETTPTEPDLVAAVNPETPVV